MAIPRLLRLNAAKKPAPNPDNFRVLSPLGAPNGDKTRKLSGFGAGFFAAFNRNKRGIAIDVKSDKGREVAQKLIEGADVVIENYAPGTMERPLHGPRRVVLNYDIGAFD